MASTVIRPTPNTTVNNEKKEAFVEFPNGQKCPLISLGTWQSEEKVLIQAVKDAICAGYRHIDCAHVYGNQKAIGQSLQEIFKEGQIKREDIFLTSKLWNTFHKPESVEPALRKTLNELQIDCVDLYLMHWPMAYKEGSNDWPKDANGKMQYSDACIEDTWKAMEKCVEKGLVKSLGMSNFNSKQIECLLSYCKIRPVVVQVESSPYLTQKKLRQFLLDKNIAMGVYSPLGSPGRPKGDKPPGQTKEDPVLLEDPKLNELAKKYNVTPAQICLRYQLQRGNILAPKSVTKSRIQSNYNLFHFNICKEDVEQIESLDRGLRYTTFHWDKDHRDFPFNEEF